MKRITGFTLTWLLASIFSVNVYAGFLGFGGDTSSVFSWDEDVKLQDGRVLPIKRSISPSGHHPISHQTISFELNSENVTWEIHPKWPVGYTPVILDLIANDPIIVMEISKYVPCDEYDFPQEGLVAFRYQQKKWARVPIKDLPNNLALNLLGGPGDLEYRPEYKGVRATNEIKKTLDYRTVIEEKQGTSLNALIKYNSNLGPLDSCASIRPTPDAKRDAARASNAAAVQNAKAISAILERVIAIPEKLSNEERYPHNNLRFGAGYFDVDCKGVVDRLEPMYELKTGSFMLNKTVSQSLSGYQIYLSNEAAINRQVQLPYAPNMGGLMNRLVCSGNEIYAISRLNNEAILVYEITNLGELKHVSKVTLPEVDKVSIEHEWAKIWDVKLDNNDLIVDLVVGGGDESDVLTRQQIYRVKLE